MGKCEILFVNSVSTQVCFQAGPGAITCDIVTGISAHTANADHLFFLQLPQYLSHGYLPVYPPVSKHQSVLVPLYGSLPCMGTRQAPSYHGENP